MPLPRSDFDERVGEDDFFAPSDLDFVAQPTTTVAPVTTAAPAVPAPPAWQPLAETLTNIWQRAGIDPMMSGINRAEELGKILANYGITDLSKLGLKDVSYTEYQPEMTGSGDNAFETGVMLPVERTGKQLTYGDKAFGYLGGFGSKGQEEFGTQPFGMYEYMQDPNLLAWSAAGHGNVSYRTAQGPDGKVYILPEWGSSSDWGDVRNVAKLAATVASMGGAGAALGASLGLSGAAAQAVGNALLGGISSGSVKGAIAGGLGSLASPYIGDIAKTAGEAVGGGTLGDIASRAVSGAGTSALGAAISGKDIGEALLSGGLGGAAGAATSGLVGDLGLPEPVIRVGTTALTSALLGQDVEKALTNAIKGEIMRAAREPAVTDTGDETNRLIARYGTAEQAQERENAALDDLMASLAPSPEPLPSTGVFELEDLLAQPEEKPVGMTPVEREKFLEANIEDPLERLLARPTEEVDWASVYATPSVDPETGQVVAQAPTTEELKQYPGLTSVQDFGTTPQSDINQVYERIVNDMGGFASTWQTVGSDRVQVQDDGSAIGINTETNEVYSLDDAQVADMVDKGLLNTKDSGYDAAIGKEPPAAAPAPSPAPAPAPSPAPAPAPGKKTDLSALFALLGMLGGQQQKQEQYQVADVRGARSPFGSLLDETESQDELLRILRG